MNTDLLAFSCAVSDSSGAVYHQEGLSKLEFAAISAQNAILGNPLTIKEIIGNSDIFKEISEDVDLLVVNGRYNTFFKCVAKMAISHASTLLNELKTSQS
jgi:hypothetical protein